MAVWHTMFVAFVFVVACVTSAAEVRVKRQELLPPLEMRLQDNIPGQPVLDYPIFDEVPDSSFRCSSQQHPGYYADLDARCQVFHICQFSGRQDSFLCPNGTVFDQRYFVCNWWFNVDCTLSPTFYSFNSQLFVSSDSSLLVQEVVSQDVSFDPPHSLPVPGVVGGGSVIPSLREAHSLDDPGFVPSPRDWEIASTSGSVSSWSRPSDHATRGRSMAPVRPVTATSSYPNEENFDYRMPVTTYRPLVPYRPPETRIVNERPSKDRYPQGEETFPEEMVPEEEPAYYSHPRPIPERQTRVPVDVGTVTNTYPEEEFFSRETFVEDATEVSEREKPVPLTPEEAVSLMPDYDTYTGAPEPSPFDEDFNYGRKLHAPTAVTPDPVQLTSPRVKIRHQQNLINYPAEEDLPLEEMLPVTEHNALPGPGPTPAPYYSPRPPQTPLPVPDPIHQRPLLEPDADYRSLQFVSSRIPVIAPNGHSGKPAFQTQTTRQALEFVSTPTPRQADFRSTPNIQILSTPSPVQESSTEYSNVSVESMTRDTISFGQSYLPDIPDAQSALPVGGESGDVQNNNLFEYGTPEEAPINMEEAVTPPINFQSSRRPTYPTQYSSLQEPLSAQGPSPRHPLKNPTLNYPDDDEFIPPAIPASNSPTSTPVYSLSNILEESVNHNNVNHNNVNHNNVNHNSGNHNSVNHNNVNHNNLNHNNVNHNNVNHNSLNNVNHNSLNNVNHNNGNHNNVNHNVNHNNVNHNVNHNNGNHNNGNHNNGNHNSLNNVNHNNVNHNNVNHNNVNHNNVNHNNVNHNNVNHNNVNHNNVNHNNVNHNNLNNVNHNNLNNVNHNKLNNVNQNINNLNNQYSNGFGPLEILTVDNKPVQGLAQANVMAHRPTYVNIGSNYGSSTNHGQLEEIVVPRLAHNLLSPYPQRTSLQNNQFGQQNPSRSPHFNRINNNQNGVFNTNNHNGNFNQFGISPEMRVKQSLMGVINQYRGANLVQAQNQHQNGKGKPIPTNGFLTNPRKIQPLSVPLISVPILKPVDKEWTVDKSSATTSHHFNVRGGSRPLVIRLAADPRVPPQIEINRRIGNGATHTKHL